MGSEEELNELLGVTYVVGDAIRSVRNLRGRNILAHIVNNSGGWGRGFVVPLGATWPVAERAYRQWHRDEITPDWDVHEAGGFALGATQLVRVTPHVMVANMCAQNGYPTAERLRAVDYDAVKECMETVLFTAQRHQASIHMPRIGCGLGGGTWVEILDCIWKARVDVGNWLPSIFVYDLPQGR